MKAPFKIQIYAGRPGFLSRKQWYARVISLANNENLFKSSEGYNNLQDLVDVTKFLFPGAPIEFMDPPSAVVKEKVHA